MAQSVKKATSVWTMAMSASLAKAGIESHTTSRNLEKPGPLELMVQWILVQCVPTNSFKSLTRLAA